MAKGRFISRKVGVDPKLNQLDDTCFLFYLMLIPQLDAEGRMHGDAVIVKGTCCPKREWSVQDVESMLIRLQGIKREDGYGLLERYTVKGMHCLWMAGFEGEQVGLRKDHEAKGKYGYSDVPPPPASLLRVAKKSIDKTDKDFTNKDKSNNDKTNKGKSLLDQPVISDETLSKMANYYEEKIGKVATPAIADKIKSIAERFTFSQFKEAMDKPQTLTAGSPIAYIERILESEDAANKRKPTTAERREESITKPLR